MIASSRTSDTSNFPSFSEGLSLRPNAYGLFYDRVMEFPFLFGRAFIEAQDAEQPAQQPRHFPSFSEGLSLRLKIAPTECMRCDKISLPFRKGFH